MGNNSIISFIGESGIFPLLLFLFLITLLISRHFVLRHDLGRFCLRRNPTDRLLLVMAMHLAMLLLSVIGCRVISGPLDGVSLTWIYSYVSYPWVMTILAIPLMRSGTFISPSLFLKTLLVMSAVANLIVSALLCAGCNMIRYSCILFFLLFVSYSAIIVMGVKYNKTWKEVVLVVNNIYFLLAVFVYLVLNLLYAILWMNSDMGIVFILESLCTLVIYGGVLYWFRCAEKKLVEYSLYNVPSIKKQVANILYDDGIDNGAYSIKGRLYSLFENEKPYLSPDLSLPDICEMLCTNKSYLSKVINNDLKMNFKEFVNRYRVNEAIRLFKENHCLTLKELCELSGFKNISSFNNAFKLATGSTPGEWCRKVKKGESENECIEGDISE